MLAAFGLIWVLAALGWLARRAGLLDGGAERALSRFVLHLAMPAALFGRVAAGGFDRGLLAAGAAFLAGSLAVGAAGYWVSARWFAREPGERAIAGMVAGYVNSANLGIPVALHVLGGSTVVVAAIGVQVLLLTPLMIVLLDRAGGGGRPPLARLLTLPLRNPIIIACAAGAGVAAAGWSVPAFVGTCASTLGAAAVPAALVALGMSLAAPPADPPVDRRELAALGALKLVAQPVLTYAVARWGLHLPPDGVRAVTVFAALPTAQVTYVLAAEYGTAVALATRAIVVTTALAMVTIWLVAAVLPAGG
ncbi:membrane protein [Pilimelia anulata]|uniref:Membrane protein n=1 Tax=Pilimelia anulata TaxID=53371 RepID=A0A8J3FCQ5_9ACTN|nr:AEC family transporter [Pilimelia anulata]GGJ92700.1 membrane protein [Pilimelia anulata]